MYAITLTSIPPRFDRLGPVLKSLLDQDPAPDRVILSIPEHFERFPEAFTIPKLPNGVSGRDMLGKAIDNNLLLIPGKVFSDQDTHFRLAYAVADEKLQLGIEVMKKIASV